MPGLFNVCFSPFPAECHYYHRKGKGPHRGVVRGTTLQDCWQTDEHWQITSSCLRYRICPVHGAYTSFLYTRTKHSLTGSFSIYTQEYSTTSKSNGKRKKKQTNFQPWLPMSNILHRSSFCQQERNLPRASMPLLRRWLGLGAKAPDLSLSA